MIGQRFAGCWASDTTFSIDLDTQSTANTRLAVYCLDFDTWQGGRKQLLEILDPASGEVLSSAIMDHFSGGKYLVWDISGQVRIRASRLVGNAVISALFFDAPQAVFLSARGSNDGSVQFKLAGEAWHPYAIQRTTDSIEWQPVSLIQNIGGVSEITENPPKGTGRNFYRAVRLP